VNEDGPEIVNCRWLAEAVLDAVGVCGLRGSFVGCLSVLGLHPFLFRGGQRQHSRKRKRACVGTLIGGLFGDRRFILRTLFRSFVAQGFFWLRPWTYTQGPLFVGRDYRDAGMHRTYDLALRVRVDPAREFGQRFIDPPPKGDAVCNRGRCRNRAEAGNLLVSNGTVDAMGLDQAALQPGGCLAKADEHDPTGITWSPSARIRRSSGSTSLCGS
jgi:hypothetical protein